MLNLLNNYRLKTTDNKKTNRRLFTAKLKSSEFLTIFTLVYLNKIGTPKYGYEILNDISKLFDEDFWCPSHATLYPILKSMVKKRYVQYAAPPEGDKIRISSTKLVSKEKGGKYYVITDIGREVLEQEIGDFKDTIQKSDKFFKILNKEINQC